MMDKQALQAATDALRAAPKDCSYQDCARMVIEAWESALWRPIEEAPRDGTKVMVARDMGDPWGWVLGFGHWEECRGISGWLCRGIYDPPGELGLGHPDLFRTIPRPASR